MAIPRFALPAAAVLLAAACTATDEPGSASARGERECFHVGNVSSFTPLERDAVAVRVGARDYYRLELVGTCPDIDWALDVAIRTRGSSWVCRGYDAELIVPHPSGTQYCPVRSVRRLSEAEVEALRAR
jgi:hypothetical protein